MSASAMRPPRCTWRRTPSARSFGGLVGDDLLDARGTAGPDDGRAARLASHGDRSAAPAPLARRARPAASPLPLERLLRGGPGRARVPSLPAHRSGCWRRWRKPGARSDVTARRRLVSASPSLRQHRAVDDVDLDVRRGEIFGLLGPNGAGKTTTIRVVTTLSRAERGVGRGLRPDVTRDAMRVRAAHRLRAQQLSADATLTGRENVMLFTRLFDVPAARAPRAGRARCSRRWGSATPPTGSPRRTRAA